MAKINSSSNSKIQEVKGFGITGYSVEFSIKDLFTLASLSQAVYCKHEPGSPEVQLAEVIRDLFVNTVGMPDTEWDFLKKEEGAK
jgi:hypothetical protein